MTGNPDRMTVPRFRRRKQDGPPLVVLTAYDAPTAATAEAGGVDALLVGDSLGNVLLGYDSTLPVTLDEMLHHAAAVARVRTRALLIGDMPWMSYHLDPIQAVENAGRMIKEAGVDAVKIEGGACRCETVHAMVEAQIPVMGHLGLTPQSVLAMGGYKVQGRGEGRAAELVEDARALEDAGVFSIVLEGMPGEVARRVTEAVGVPTIGIGAGVGCDGQVLVYHDLLGLTAATPPKFVRTYDNGHERHADAIRRWARDVRERSFPGAEESYD